MAAGPYESRWESLDKRPLPGWFNEAKFGVFICWGPYSVPSWAPKGTYAECYGDEMRQKGSPTHQFHLKNYGADFKYEQFGPMLKGELWDPDSWADLIARSGAKYVVFTSNYHDGYCTWPSPYHKGWNSVDVGPKRDVLGELTAAVRKRNVKMGIYYSLYECYHPLWQSDRKRFVDEHLFPQFKDVVTRYQPAVVFSDGEWDMDSKDWKTEHLLAWLFNESSCRNEVVVNDRWGKDCRHKHGGYWTTEYAAGLKDASHAWEENRGMGFSYGCNRAERIDDYKTARELILILCDLVSRGGNFLLDIGPQGDGTIPVIMEQRLLEIGDWLKVNGEAIYGTRYAGHDCQWSEGKRPRQQFGEFMVKYDLIEQVGQRPKGGVAVKQAFFTKKPGALYAITPGWPGKDLVLRDLRMPAEAVVTMLGVPGTLKYRTEGSALVITLPDLGPDEAPCRHAFAFKITGAEVLPGGTGE
jgi:alpha-L-fucosidase